jgi:hypothetical protein
MVDDLEGRLCHSRCTCRQDWLISVDRMPRPRKPASPFRCFNSSPEVIRFVVMMYMRFPLSLRNVEDLLFGRGNDLCHETVRMWWNRFGPMFAGKTAEAVAAQDLQRTHGPHHYRWSAVSDLQASKPLPSVFDARRAREDLRGNEKQRGS